MMAAARLNGVPVAENGRMIGIITDSDIIAREAADVDALISGGLPRCHIFTLTRAEVSMTRCESPFAVSRSAACEQRRVISIVRTRRRFHIYRHTWAIDEGSICTCARR